MVTRGRVLTIAPRVPFLDALAAGLLHETRHAPESLADCLILVPTRRACRSLAEAFLRVSDGRPLLLPDIRPLGGDDDETVTLRLLADDTDLALPPEIPRWHRELLLTRLIMEWRKRDEGIQADQALSLARELARLLDQIQTERLDTQALEHLAPEQFAEHWQDVLEFLAIVTESWPGILADEDCIDPADRRNRLLEAQAERWRAVPPQTPVVAAGSTGSIPATAELLSVIAQLPHGRIVLPGLDRSIDEVSLKAALDEATHPQYGMLRLLRRLGVNPSEVREWDAGPGGPAPSSPPERTALAIEALRPTATTDAWRALATPPDRALEGVERVDCANEAEEAGVVALILRHALEVPDRTAALVTRDSSLSRRVAAELARWDIEIDDSAGQPIMETPPGLYLRHVVRAAAAELSPVSLLALLKHPFASGGMDRQAFRHLVRDFERRILRGPRPAPGIAGLRACLAASDTAGAAIAPLLDVLEARLARLSDALMDDAASLASLIDLHLVAAEALADDDAQAGADKVWRGEDGEQLARSIAELRDAARTIGTVAGPGYAPLFEALMAEVRFRPRYGLHPRLHIWGPLEARLLHADLMVLGGLNERSWPPDPDNDPWMSRPMRARFGLPPREWKIGLAAHDFAQAFAAPRVVLVRAAKSEGAPTVPSRWLSRLQTVLESVGRGDALSPSRPWIGLYRGLSNPSQAKRIDPPAPRPPVAARPRTLSVTRIETWMREPYAIYAERILNLRPLDPLEADPGAAERGSFIHEALDRFVREHPGPLPADSLAHLTSCGEAAFGAALTRPAVRAVWWPRFLRVAAWFLDVERARRAGEISVPRSEIAGRIEIAGPAGPFVLTAKADRIDSLAAGGFVIIDYKTGTPPSQRLVQLGLAPQLALEALILSQGGFEGLPAGNAELLAYWRLSGGEPPGEIVPVKAGPQALLEAAGEGLARLVSAFDRPETPYHAAPRPDHPAPYNVYEHLARTLEWSTGGRGET
ncbi:MAG: double-strand break repair protein AddB [Rhodospirillales bacterium]|nr:MAG: double-strand break repair protein AddB [Rhodospirillales bacterium]